MRISLNTSKWYDRIWASFIFFTRLPFWRLYQPPKNAYETVVEHWPLVGWFTGGVMAATLIGCRIILPLSISVIMAILARLLITGALHEDGLADFCDGFGGGNTKEKILEIMKDSRIGTYGVIGLIIYIFLLYYSLLNIAEGNRSKYIFFVILSGDSFSKMIAGQIVQMMPYARTPDTAKNGVVYRKFSTRTSISLSIQGMIPIGIFLYFLHFHGWQWMFFIPCIMMYFLYILMNKKIGGYTGDCCGALCLLIELSFYLVVNALI